ncbi:MAG: sulfurtransferase FdhD [Methanocalculus sp. MSAO_Arc2]|uniref:formate dehydrogenase accessory sulfurtransferase FdhD n=1 Tax=Methanocalculus sp. MSAO_Arc2 TaxID=2293855 RepID=UPI000FEEE0EA|nr:MAG: sulfurtransferase FdhD [Methanocalculus sp. MSAO_Arc2]
MQQNRFGYVSIPCLRVHETGYLESTCEIPEETVTAIFVNGRHAATMVLSPENLREYIIGYLFSEEIIKTAGDIESIRYEPNRISVLTRDPFRITGRRRTVLAGCGGSVSSIDTSKLPTLESGYTIPYSVLFQMQKAIEPASDQVHSAALATTSKTVVTFHDIDCQCAVDRVLGYGLIHAIDFSETVLLLSGIVTSEMVRRCLLAGIPILLSTTTATRLAISIGTESNLTIGGNIFNDEITVFTHPERIRCSW